MIFRWDCRNCSLRIQRNVLGRKSLRELCKPNIFSEFVQLSCQVVKTAFYPSTRAFFVKKIVVHFQFFFNFLWIVLKILEHRATYVSRWAFWETFYCNITFFVFSDLEQKIFNFGWKLLTKLSSLHFTWPDEFFEEKKLNWIFDFNKRFGQQKQNIWTNRPNNGAICQKCFLRVTKNFTGEIIKENYVKVYKMLKY